MELIDKCISKGVRMASRIIDGEAIIVKIGVNEKKNIMVLSKTGTKIWALIEDMTPIRDVIKEIATENKLDFDEVKDEILDYIQNLVKKEIIDVSKD